MSSTRVRIRSYLGRLLFLVVPLAMAFGAAELVLRMAGQPGTANDESAAAESPWLKVEKSAELG